MKSSMSLFIVEIITWKEQYHIITCQFYKTAMAKNGSEKIL